MGSMESPIISNALKYSHENGQLVINISKSGSKTTCSISDNGIGISATDLDKIVNPFFRSDPTSHPEIKGSGLGLSIVERITRLLNIEFKIESELNKGTTVIFVFD